jgi:hypothetical protein
MPERNVGQGTYPSRSANRKNGTDGVCSVRALVKYASRKAARKALKSILASGRKSYQTGTFHEFQCPTCGGWHLSH